MNVNPITSIRWLFFAILLLANCTYGQFYNNGSSITVTNDAVIYLKGMDLINVDSTIYNYGTIIVEGDCRIGKKTTSRIVTGNSDSLIVYKNFLDSSDKGQSSGVVVLKGGNQSIYSSSNSLSSLSLQGSGNKTLQSDAHVSENLSLQNGHIIVPSNFVFGLDSMSSLSPSSIGNSSFVVGSLYRKRKLGVEEDSLFYPIGSSVAEYRPVLLSGISFSGGKRPIIAVSTKLSTPVAGNEVATVYNRIWNVSNPSNATVQNIKLYYQASEVGSTSSSNLVVAQSSTETGKYNSIGSLTSNTAFVKSDLKPTEMYYTIGSSSNLKGNFKVFLEGPYVGSGVMKDSLFAKGILKDTLLKMYPMTAGYTVPANAVDRIAFTLIDIVSGSVVDTAFAWLLSDGQIRDYMTGTKAYVTFSKAQASTQYYAYVAHRNHLPASSNSLILSTAKPVAYDYDFSKGVYGGGAKYDVGSNMWLLYASDPYKSWKNQSDVIDLTRTWADEDAGTYRATGKYYYRYTDLNLDGVVNSSDQTIANDHNNKLFYSTLPK